MTKEPKNRRTEEPKGRRRTKFWFFGSSVLGIYLLILSAVAAAPNDPQAGTAADVLICDFEDASDRDYDGWPDGWIRQRSRDLPPVQLSLGVRRQTQKTLRHVV